MFHETYTLYVYTTELKSTYFNSSQMVSDFNPIDNNGQLWTRDQDYKVIKNDVAPRMLHNTEVVYHSYDNDYYSITIDGHIYSSLTQQVHNIGFFITNIKISGSNSILALTADHKGLILNSNFELIHDPISEVALMLRYGQKDYPYDGSIVLNYLTIDGYLMQKTFGNNVLIRQLDETNIRTDGFLKYYTRYITITNKVYYLNYRNEIEKVLDFDFEIVDSIDIDSNLESFSLNVHILLLLDSTGLIHIIEDGKYIRSEPLMQKQLNDHHHSKWCKFLSAPRKKSVIIMNTLGHCYIVSNNFFMAPLEMYTEVYSQSTVMVKSARFVN